MTVHGVEDSGHFDEDILISRPMELVFQLDDVIIS